MQKFAGIKTVVYTFDYDQPLLRSARHQDISKWQRANFVFYHTQKVPARNVAFLFMFIHATGRIASTVINEACITCTRNAAQFGYPVRFGLRPVVEIYI